VRSTLPIWSPELRQRGLQELPERAREAAVAGLAVLRQFANAHAPGIFFQGLIFIGMVFVARLARQRPRALHAREEGMPLPIILIERPYSSGALVALTSIFWLYPDRPQTLVDLVGILLLVPVLRIVRPHISAALAPALYGFAVLCLVDRVRAELAVIPLADQALLLIVMLVAMTGLAWLLGSGRLRRLPPIESAASSSWCASPAAAAVTLAICTASFAAAAYGTMRLARLLGAGLLVGILMALVAYSAVQVTDGLARFALRVRPLRHLGMVARHRDLLERRIHVLVCWLASLAWLIGTLRFHGLLAPTLSLARAALGAELRRGTMAISLGDLFAFVITVWLAFLVSACIRFVLEEDVYPRLRLARGLPYVISSLLHYSVVFLGFLLAVAALGVDLNRFTVLAGAFGVGLGFGLQGVVNNFVSGLIVLFERPIRVGDAIQMSDLAGEVQRIGIRMTIVRTWEGADVIVPNATLVSDKVTNWTRSDLLRRIDIAVAVSYGSAPKEVQALLLAVARAHPAVLAYPEPEALFLGFGESALNFELRAWTNRFSQWVTIRSELGMAIHDAVYEAGMSFPYPHRVIQLLRDSESESVAAPLELRRARQQT